MNPNYTPEELAFREEVRSFIRTSLPRGIREKTLIGQRASRDDIVEWTRILHRRGWATPSWPAEWGGPGWNAVEQYIFAEELYMAPAPELLGFNVNMIGPTLIAFGSDEQKRRFLPRIASLEYWFCQGFSEPGAGSDLASLRTRAVRDGDDYVVSGQKIWTTMAHLANWCFLLVRTDPAARPQRGITYLMVDMTTPGITVHPLITVDGAHEFNEVFFDDVRVPVANRVGEENRGWDYAKYLLSHERSGVARVGLSKSRISRAKTLARTIERGGEPLSRQPAFVDRVTRLEVELKALEMLQMRVLAASRKLPSGQIDPRTSILKIRGSELNQATAVLLADIAGPAGLEYDPDFVGGAEATRGAPDWAAMAQPNSFWLRHASISGGSNEIQRNILAKSVLGL